MITRIVVMSAVLLLAGCGVPEPAASNTGAPALAGTEWRLVSFGPEESPQQALPNTTVMVGFTETTAQGSFGCNSFGGSYTLNGQQITFSELVQTEMACPPPIMQQEDQVVAALQSAHTFTLDGDTLRLSYPDGVLRFTRVEPAADRPLEGTPWQLTTFVSGEVARSLVTDTQITATFEGGRVTGSAGCNNYSGTYTLTDGALSVGGDIITTKKACPPPVMQQEREFLDALAATTRYEISGAQLTLVYPDGQLVFAAGEPERE